VIHRSYLFAPGHNAKLLSRVFEAGADAVVLDLEDAVPTNAKDRARAMVAEALQDRPAIVRVNGPGTPECEADLAAVAGAAAGIRIPKCETPEEVVWVAERAPGIPLICAIETAVGVLAAARIAAIASVEHLSMGGVDLRRDLRAGAGVLPALYVRSHLVVVSRAAGLAPPIDSVYPQLDDDAGLLEETRHAHALGFFGKSAIHPRQLPILHEVFTPSEEDLSWARKVLAAFDAAGGAALRLPDGEFVDKPVAERARRLLDLADRRPAEATGRPTP
jgi:citrate lyase subunit beta/citryl-CoA lyase